jgi:lon-related putative ATP-dependent protease
MDECRLNPEMLRWRCDTAQFAFTTTGDLPLLEETIGQDRALAAIDFGLGIRDGGFNLFILGQPGTGRSSTIKKILEKRSAGKPVPDDWCYVNDLDDGTHPFHIRLPAGKGRELKKDVDHLIERLAEQIPKVFDSKEYEEQKKKIALDYKGKHDALIAGLEQEANKNGFALHRAVSGLVMMPVRNDEPLSQEEYEALDDEAKTGIEKRGAELQERIDEVLRQVRALEEEMRQKIIAMEKEILLYSIGHLFEELEKKYADFAGIIEHFARCKKDIIERLDEVRPQKETQVVLPGMKSQQEGPSFHRYQVNLLVDNSTLDGAPVIYEANPTYFNLFGRIEHVIQMGNATTSFEMIKAGALHRANGGSLILDCREVLFNTFSYEALKRCIRNREVKIEDMVEQFRLIATVTLKPQPIPLDCKIILIGTPLFYYLLFQLDPDFRKLFKVKVDFDEMMKSCRENIQQYALFIGTKCAEEKLLHFDLAAVARTIEYAARLVEDQEHLSCCFIDIADLIREASFYAEKQEAEQVAEEHVNLAIDARIYRSNKIEERIQEFIEDGTILVDTEGAVTGQVNGLTVYQLGDYSFGRPARVTVRTFLGTKGMVNIEREAKLSGPIHDKGVLILNGFFGQRYAQDKPLALSASIGFEQVYSGVEGDSASSTELYGLLSSLSGLPVKQGIAVTGSVNQHGRIQPIGGVNQKIEGFYAVCKSRGLTGDQGVIIPQSNQKNLMLKTEVVDAVAEGKFHIWSVATIDQGIEILTGVPAGELDENGAWPEGTINDLVDRRLRNFAETAQSFSSKQT